MEFLIVTGMSGAGKSHVLNFLEDIGFFCIDNMPPTLIPKFAELIFGQCDHIKRVALGVDIRGGRLFDDFLPLLDCPESGLDGCSIIFLDASDEVLLKRYKETRRKHPLSETDVMEGIQQERQRLAKIKNMASHIIDTTYLLPRQTKEKINLLFLENRDFNSLAVTLLSFGFNHGAPHDADLLFDVRFLPNPFYDPEMKHKTGNDDVVRDFVLRDKTTQTFLDKTADLLEFLVPQYIQEGKNQLIISIGCTGGKHRSVTVANYLANHLRQAGYFANAKHRDIGVI